MYYKLQEWIVQGHRWTNVGRPDDNFVLVTAPSQWMGNEPPLFRNIVSSGLQVNDKFFTAEFDDIIRHYLFSLADLFGAVDLYLTIRNQHLCLSPGACHPFELQNLKKLDRLF